MAISAGVALLVKMKIDQSTMKVTVETQGNDIRELKTGQTKQDEKANTILISLAKIETKLGITEGITNRP